MRLARLNATFGGNRPGQRPLWRPPAAGHPRLSDRLAPLRLGWGRAGGQRKADPEAASLAQGALRLDRPAIGVADRLHDGEAEPGTFRMLGPGAAGAEKAVEDAGQVLRGDPGARVGHLEDGVRRREEHPQADGPALGRVLDRIVEEIDHDLLQAPAVPVDPDG